MEDKGETTVMGLQPPGLEMEQQTAPCHHCRDSCTQHLVLVTGTSDPALWEVIVLLL